MRLYNQNERDERRRIVAHRDPRRVFKADKKVYPAGHLTCGLDRETREVVAE